MNEMNTKRTISAALNHFSAGNLAENAQALFQTLGYQTDKAVRLEAPTPQAFVDSFAQGRTFNLDNALLQDWQFVDLLFQITKDEITGSDQLRINFGSQARVDNTIIESYLFFAVALTGGFYTRTQLAGITREVNKLFSMPVMLLFKHGQTVTLSIINRRLHKRDESKDVLEKVTLIKDIDFARPHRAHVEILFDLSLEQLYKAHRFTNFVELHQAWQKTLDSTELNKQFFREVSNWYFWATQNVVFPAGAEADEEVRNATSVIRMITRLIFVWFLKEKSVGEKALVPEELFQRSHISQLIHFDEPNSSTYYKAILQNLFFATLNQEMNTPEKPDNRKFRHERKPGQRDQHYMVHNIYRYRALFKQPEEALKLFETVPFLNGGLFECLDQIAPDNPKQIIRIDGFSDRADNVLSVPNYLFFTEEREVDLNEIYGTKNKRFKVRGLIDIFNSYKFTITENTPIEEEIALDPELLGKVFENLLAAYNSETRATARKQTGSFYTPREVVDYMVDESLLVYLATQMIDSGLVDEAERGDLEQRLRTLLDYKTKLNPFNDCPEETAILIAAIDRLKMLDPAVGSGAFPMGLLQKLVFILGKLDPNNERWKYQQKEREILPVLQDIQQAQHINYEAAREAAVQQLQERLWQIEADFSENEMDYPRKLFLIENSIYGVDIQPIAVQIAKLRFFVSLIVEQRVNESLPNRGILPLPNLETKFIAANTLMGIERPSQISMGEYMVQKKELELAEVRHRIFTARTQVTKQKYREKDRQLREEIVNLLETEGWSDKTATQIAQWNPYDQNASAPFFDLEWMFGIKDGFDVVIGNPPYIRIQELKQSMPDKVTYFKTRYESARKGNYDLYVVFVERGLELLNQHGNLAFILPHKFFNAQYGEGLRELLSQGKHLRKIVHFGDLQVFTSVATYVCLLFLNKFRTKKLEFTQVDDPKAWYFEGSAVTIFLDTEVITNDKWNFVAESESKIFEYLNGIPLKLGNLTSKIFQGIRTSANKIYVLDVVSEVDDGFIAYSKSLETNVEVEKKNTLKFLQGNEIRAYQIGFSGKRVIVPYTFSSSKVRLLTENELSSSSPKLYQYLLNNKFDLKNRERGKMSGSNWYAYVYPKNLDLMSTPKILVPDIADKPSFALDAAGQYAFTSGYGIVLNSSSKTSLTYILGLL